MHIPTHLLSGWVVGNLLKLTPRERVLCMAAATVPDLDGLGIVVSQELYWDLHRKLGHNIFVFVLTSTIFAIFSTHRLRMWVACFVLGWVHFGMDYLGSGPGWALWPVWPVSDWSVEWDNAWPFFSWQNLSAFAGLLIAAIVIALKQGRTPLEWITPRLDELLTPQRRRSRR